MPFIHFYNLIHLNNPFAPATYKDHVHG